MYVSIVDRAGHDHGPTAPETDAAVREADRVLGRLLDSLAVSPLAGRIDVVVVSDHGMSDVAPDRIVDLSRWISLAGVRTADPGPVFSLWFGADSARRDAAYAALGRGLAGGHARVYRRGETPAGWHVRAAPRAGDLLVVADPGWLVVAAPPAGGVHGGNHGWDPAAAPEMGAIFLAAGPDVAGRGLVPSFANVDVHPFLAHLLRVVPAAGIDGSLRALRSVLRPVAEGGW
jgi:hypothetical protein